MIRFKLEKLDRAIRFQILEQSDDIINYLPFRYKIFGQTIVEIRSDCNPELRRNGNFTTIFLRGTEKQRDNEQSVLHTYDNIERNRLFDVILLAFKELSTISKND